MLAKSMKKMALTVALVLGFYLPANADIWKWTDANGEVHFVSTTTAIYTWVGDDGRIHYSDTPDHETAVLASLVWHSPNGLADSGSSENVAQSRVSAKQNVDPTESESDKFERESAEAYYCKRAQEIYKSYLGAPRLYETSENGKRVYLSDTDVTTMLADTKARVDDLCQ